MYSIIGINRNCSCTSGVWPHRIHWSNCRCRPRATRIRGIHDVLGGEVGIRNVDIVVGVNGNRGEFSRFLVGWSTTIIEGL